MYNTEKRKRTRRPARGLLTVFLLSVIVFLPLHAATDIGCQKEITHETPFCDSLGVAGCDSIYEQDSLSTHVGDTGAGDASAAGTVAQTWSDRLHLSLGEIAKEADAAYYNTAICVWDLEADSLIWEYNRKKVMRPASTQKVLTAVAALCKLGARHEIRTTAYYTGAISADGTLHGDIYVVGDFDPMYSYSDLRSLAADIAGQGIKRIDGTLYADASMKEKELYGNGWCWDDVPSKYEPYLSALMLERGKMYPNFTNYSKDPHFHPAEHFVFVLSKSLADFRVEPADSSKTDIAYAMKEYPGGGHRFYVKSRTIEQVMQRMLKNSDNLHAEAVFYQLADLNARKYSSWKDGARQVENMLRQAGVPTAYVKVADGSGVSLYNYSSASAMVSVLRYAYRHDDIFRSFYPALPIAGVDGTLDTRMRRGTAYRNIHAKTGTLEGVISLAGYANASNGHTLAFSIIINGVLSANTARDFQDRVCEMLTR